MNNQYSNFKNSLLLITLFFFSAQLINAQDTIVKRSGEKIAAKILEIRPTEISYKQFAHPDNPIYVLPKWELLSITYENGVKESYENYSAPKTDLLIQPSKRHYYYRSQLIGEQDMLDVAWKLKDKKINLMIRKTEEQKVYKNAFLIGGGVLELAGILTISGIISGYSTKASASTVGGSRPHHRSPGRLQQVQTGGYLFLGGLACQGISIVFKIKETKHAHMVVDLYNDYVSK